MCTFNWDIKKLSIKECDRLLNEFSIRNNKYIEILKPLIDQLAKTRMPTLYQLLYVDGFIMYHRDWMIKEPEECVGIYHNEYQLVELMGA